jgi:hypothetical protein
VTVEDEALRWLQEAEDDRLDALDRRDREGEKAPAADALFGGSGRVYSTVEATAECARHLPGPASRPRR